MNTNIRSLAQQNSLPLHTAMCVSDLLSRQLALLRAVDRVSDERIKFLQNCFAEPECPQIDYDGYAADFAFAYLVRNFWKSYLTFWSHEPRVATRILDIGCGSGATSMAYLAYLNEYCEQRQNKPYKRAPLAVTVCCLDRSRAQLELANNLFGSATPEFPNLNIQYVFEHADITSWRPTACDFDLILQGHVLTENRTYVSAILEASLNIAEEDGCIYAIERENDSIWRDIELSVTRLAVQRHLGNSRHVFSPIIDSQHDDSAALSTNYLVLRIPERNDIRRLLLLYFQAWQNQDPHLLEEVFTPDATYLEKPFSAPLIGIRHIQNYWVDKVKSQRALSLDLVHVSYTNDEAVAEWRAHFIIHGGTVDVRGIMILTLDLVTRKIASLREYFRTQHG